MYYYDSIYKNYIIMTKKTPYQTELEKALSNLENFISWEHLKFAVVWDASTRSDRYLKKFVNFFIPNLPKKRLPVEILFPDNTKQFGYIEETKRESGNPNYTEHRVVFGNHGATLEMDIKKAKDLKFRISKEAQTILKGMKKLNWL